MKKLLLTILLLLIFVSTSFAQTWVNGYTRKDGTYVEGYSRSEPNDTVQDNYSYKGNSNPFTGETGSNYYRNNSSSEYYGTNNSRVKWLDDE